MQVHLVRVRTDDGLRLEGTLSRPATPRSDLPFDVAVLHHGVGGNFYNQNFFEAMTEQLLASGCAVLRVNNRGHDLMYNSPIGRLGAAYESVDDCRRDWRAWNDFAEAQGYRRICVWGHSLGAVKSIYWAANQQDPRVTRLIAVSPPRFSYGTYQGMDGAGRFQAYYQRAKALVEAGEPEALMAVDIPTSVVLAAKTYVDKYGPQERYDILAHVPKVGVPLLVTVGGEEGKGPDAPDWFSFGGLAGLLAELAARQSNLRFEVVPGADHGYNGKATELWAVVSDWLSKELAPVP